MVVHDFDPISVVIDPFEDDSPLFIDTDTIMIFEIALQFLQSVGRGNSQIIDILGVVDHSQLAARNVLNFIWQFSGAKSIADFFGFLVAKCFYHYYCVALVLSKMGISFLFQKIG